MGVQQGERAHAGADPDRPAGVGPELGQPLLCQRPGVAGRGGVRLQAIEGRRNQGGPERRYLAECDEMVEQPEKGRVLGVLRPVVDDE
jgi:hypothetical protein